MTFSKAILWLEIQKSYCFSRLWWNMLGTWWLTFCLQYLKAFVQVHWSWFNLIQHLIRSSGMVSSNWLRILLNIVQVVYSIKILRASRLLFIQFFSLWIMKNLIWWNLEMKACMLFVAHLQNSLKLQPFSISTFLRNAYVTHWQLWLTTDTWLGSKFKARFYSWCFRP